MSQAAEVPKPPEDTETRNIIDKLAQFVAKNGQDFENMTKQKQKDNPRFSFLYGGEYYDYYLCRVTVEQAIMRKRQMEPQQQQQSPQKGKVHMLQAQIDESERNLKAQYEVLMKQQETDINEAIRIALEQQILQVAEELRLNIVELGVILDGLAYPYGQEAQEVALNWICSHYSTPKHGELMVRYLLERIKDPRDYFERKLSILYLVGNLAQRSLREQNEHLLALLNRFAPIMSSYAMRMHGQHDERARMELDQLVRSWLQQHILSGMAEWRCAKVDETITQYQDELKDEYADIVANTTQRIQAQYRQYELQHQDYARHIQQQIVNEQFQQVPITSGTLPQQQISSPSLDSSATGTTQQKSQPRRSRFDDPGPAGATPLSQQPPLSLIRPMAPSASPGVSPWQQPPSHISGQIPVHPSVSTGAAPGLLNQPPPGLRYPPPSMSHPSQPPFQQSWPLGNAVSPAQPPWMTRPPLGTMPIQQYPMTSFGPALPPSGANINVAQPPPQPFIVDEQTLIPKVAYYDLPAGLMVPLMKLEDHEYEPLKPSEIRLPPPMPPSERLLAAVEAFYAPPNHEHPRDSEGWERLGLYEYYKEKAKATQHPSSKSNKHSNANDQTRGSDDKRRERRERDSESSEEDSYESSRRRRSGSGHRRSGHSESDASSQEKSDKRKRTKRHSRRRSTGSSSDNDSRSSRSDSSNRSSPSPKHKTTHNQRTRERRSRWSQENDHS